MRFATRAGCKKAVVKPGSALMPADAQEKVTGFARAGLPPFLPPLHPLPPFLAPLRPSFHPSFLPSLLLPFLPPFLPLPHPVSKAMAVWQWFGLHREALTEEIVINLDETSISLGADPPPGYRLRSSKKRIRREPPARSLSLSDRRCCFSAVVMVSNAFWLQRHLPQVLLANENTLRQRDLKHLSGLLPSNVHLWRRKSAWINVDVFENVLDLLGAVVQRHIPRGTAVLLMDTCPVHCQAKVLQACLRNRLRVVFIPALCTGLLQPLDTHIFAQFKCRLRRLLHDSLLESPSPQAESLLGRFLQFVAGALATEICGREWSTAFDGNGFGRTFSVRQSVLRKIGLESLPVLVKDLPEYEQFKVIFPAGREVDFHLLLGPFPETEAAEPPAAVEGHENNAPHAHHPDPATSSEVRAQVPRRLSSKTSLEDGSMWKSRT